MQMRVRERNNEVEIQLSRLAGRQHAVLEVLSGSTGSERADFRARKTGIAVGARAGRCDARAAARAIRRALRRDPVVPLPAARAGRAAPHARRDAGRLKRRQSLEAQADAERHHRRKARIVGSAVSRRATRSSTAPPECHPGSPRPQGCRADTSPRDRRSGTGRNGWVSRCPSPVRRRDCPAAARSARRSPMPPLSID